MGFDVRLHRKAEGFLAELHSSGLRKVADRIVEGLERISEDPIHSRPGVDILQLKSVHPKMYRLRIGQYRVVYQIDRKRKRVLVTMILHRKKSYKR